MNNEERENQQKKAGKNKGEAVKLQARQKRSRKPKNGEPIAERAGRQRGSCRICAFPMPSGAMLSS